MVRRSDGHLPEILLPRDVMDLQSLAGHNPNERQRELSVVTPKNMKNNLATRVARFKKFKIPNLAINKSPIFSSKKFVEVTRFKVGIS